MIILSDQQMQSYLMCRFFLFSWRVCVFVILLQIGAFALDRHFPAIAILAQGLEFCPQGEPLTALSCTSCWPSQASLREAVS